MIRFNIIFKTASPTAQRPFTALRVVYQDQREDCPQLAYRHRLQQQLSFPHRSPIQALEKLTPVHVQLFRRNRERDGVAVFRGSEAAA